MSQHGLRILTTGSIEPVDERTKSWLRERQGSWSLVGPAEGPLIAERADSSTAQEASNLSLCGSVEALSGMTDIVSLIASARWSGALYVFTPPVKRAIHFSDGDLRSVQSDAPGDRLGEILCRQGVITEARLEPLLAENPGLKLGALLVEREILTQHELYSYIRTQAQEVMLAVLLAQSGFYAFYRESEEAAADVSLGMCLPTQQLLLSIMQQVDEMGYFRQRIPSSYVTLRATGRSPSGSTDMAEAENALLECASAQITLSRAMEMTHLSEFDATKAAFRLLQIGCLEIVSHAEPSVPPPPPERSLVEVVEVFNELFAKVVNVAGGGAAFDKHLRSFFEADTPYRKLFEGIELQADGRLDPQTLMRNAEQHHTTEASSFLYQGLNEFLFFLMFVAGETLDPATCASLQSVRMPLDVTNRKQ